MGIYESPRVNTVNVPSNSNTPGTTKLVLEEALPSQTLFGVFHVLQTGCSSWKWLANQARMAKKTHGRLAEVGCCLTPECGQEKRAQRVWRPDTYKDLMDCRTCKFNQGRQHGYRAGNMYKMMFIESVLETDNMKGFWFVRSRSSESWSLPVIKPQPQEDPSFDNKNESSSHKGEKEWLKTQQLSFLQ